jgi:hypothetical protein
VTLLCTKPAVQHMVLHARAMLSMLLQGQVQSECKLARCAVQVGAGDVALHKPCGEGVSRSAVRAAEDHVRCATDHAHSAKVGPGAPHLQTQGPDTGE